MILGDAEESINGKTAQAVIHIQPLLEVNGDATEIDDTNNSINDTNPPLNNGSDAAAITTPTQNTDAIPSFPIEATVTIEPHHSHSQCSVHSAETHTTDNTHTNESASNPTEATNTDVTVATETSSNTSSGAPAERGTATMAIGNAEQQVLARGKFRHSKSCFIRPLVFTTENGR